MMHRYGKRAFFTPWLFLLGVAVGCMSPLLAIEEGGYQFYGRHLIAQYYDCDFEALCDTGRLSEVMKQAAKASGAHLLGTKEHLFEGNGYSMILLLSESHASVHTYPEHTACFVDLFTCGQNCSAENFDMVLREYLKPKQVESRIIIRN
jgi:S-adenosylmethionine decarboxylase